MLTLAKRQGGFKAIAGHAELCTSVHHDIASTQHQESPDQFSSLYLRERRLEALKIKALFKKRPRIPGQIEKCRIRSFLYNATTKTSRVYWDDCTATLTADFGD